MTVAELKKLIDDFDDEAEVYLHIAWTIGTLQDVKISETDSMFRYDGVPLNGVVLEGKIFDKAAEKEKKSKQLNGTTYR